MPEYLIHKIAISTGATILAIVIVDIFLWCVVPHAQDSAGNKPEQILGQPPELFEYDSFLGWTTRPSVNIEIQGKRFSHNSRGIRGPEVRLDKNPGKKRIMLLGDSQVYGWGLSDNETIDSYIDNEFGDDRLETLNFGVSGYGIDQSLLHLIRDGIPYKPDLIIFILFPENDFGEVYNTNAWGLEKPALLDRGEGLCLYNVPPMRSGAWPGSAVKDTRLAGLEDVLKSLAPIFPHINRFFENRFWRDNIFRSLANDYRTIRSPYLPPMCEEGSQIAETPPEQLVKLPARLLLRMKEIADENGARLLVLSKPWIVETSWGKRLLIQMSRLRSILQANNIEYIELGPIMRERGVSGKDLYLPYFHLTALGNKEVARVVVDWAKANKPVDKT